MGGACVGLKMVWVGLVYVWASVQNDNTCHQETNNMKWQHMVIRTTSSHVCVHANQHHPCSCNTHPPTCTTPLVPTTPQNTLHTHHASCTRGAHWWCVLHLHAQHAQVAPAICNQQPIYNLCPGHCHHRCPVLCDGHLLIQTSRGGSQGWVGVGSGGVGGCCSCCWATCARGGGWDGTMAGQWDVLV